MNLIDLIIISIVEGLTEFLPVSSTGHMMIAEGLLGVEMTTFVKSFTVIIQLGAILAVVVLYWRKFFYPSADALGTTASTTGDNASSKGNKVGLSQWWSRIWPFYLKLIVGVLPAVVVGTAKKKENSAAILRVSFCCIPPTMVAIERDVPGSTAAIH